MRFHLLMLRSRIGRLAAAATCAGVVLAVAPAVTADAAGRKIGPVTGLSVTATKNSTGYRVASAWNRLTGATSYRVAMSDATGTVLAKGTVTAPSWAAQTTRPAGTKLTVKVTPLAGKRPGKSASLSTVLPDLTAPTGTFHLDQTVAHVVVTQDSLSDDVSAPANIARSIDWGDGAGWTAWGSGTTVTHDYATGVHYPQVRLVDEALNTATLPLHVVVVGDITPPTGTFSVAPLTGWAKLTPVRITQDSLSDDFSAPEHVARVVDWNDGTPVVTWPSGTTLDHVYRTAGTHTPTVQLTDEAENAAAPITLDAVVTKSDVVAPRVTLRRPATHKGYVSSWRTLRGRATDTNGSGVRKVTLRVVEKRGTAWYGYRATTRTWARAATKAGAVRKSRVASVTPNALHRYAYRLPGLRKGTMIVSWRATDRVGNSSATRSYRRVLNHR